MDIEPTINGLEKRYGVSRENFKELLSVGQIMGYECWRAMFEAYGRNFPDGTGVFGWMLNSSWGKVFWQLYDYYLVPTGGFYGTQKACEKIHCQYSYDDNSVWLLNYGKKDRDVSVTISLYDKNSNIIYEEHFEKNILKSQKIKIANVNTDKVKDDFFILKLKYSGKSNVYWLTKSKDEFEKEHSQKTWFYRPQTQYADLSPILTMPRTVLETKVKIDGNGKKAEISVKNSGKYFAVAVQLDFADQNGELYYPIYFSENLLWLAPDETTEVIAEIPNSSSASFEKLKFRCEAINA